MTYPAHPFGEAAPSTCALLGAMTPMERRAGRYMRAPDHSDAAPPPAAAAPETGFLSIDEAAATLRLPSAEPEKDNPVDPGAPSADDLTDEELFGAEAPKADAENEDDAGGEQDKPAIAAPVSWKAEDKAIFAVLPPEAQQIVAARESEREKFVQSKATEAAEAKRTAAQAEAAIGQVADHFTAQLQRFLSTETPAEPDEALLESDPVEYMRQERAVRLAYAQRAQAQQQMDQATQWRAEQDANAAMAFQAEQSAILAERLPGWSDDTTRQTISAEITSLASAHGYTAERLANADADDVMFLHQASQWKAKAEKFDKLVADKMAVVRAAKDLPKMAKPGNGQSVAEGGNAARRADAASSFRFTHSAADAAALLYERRK